MWYFTCLFFIQSPGMPKQNKNKIRDIVETHVIPRVLVSCGPEATMETALCRLCVCNSSSWLIMTFWEEALNLGFMLKLTWERGPKIGNYLMMLIYASIALYLELYLIFVDSDLTWITEKFLWLGFCCSLECLLVATIVALREPVKKKGMLFFLTLVFITFLSSC